MMKIFYLGTGRSEPHSERAKCMVILRSSGEAGEAFRIDKHVTICYICVMREYHACIAVRKVSI